MATTPTFYPYSPEPHRGIAQSVPVARNVIKLRRHLRAIRRSVLLAPLTAERIRPAAHH